MPPKGKKSKKPASAAPPPPPPLPEDVKAGYINRINKAFAVFALGENDAPGEGSNKMLIDVREIGTVLRSLGICMSEEELKGWVAEMQEGATSEQLGYVTLEKFTSLALRIMPSRIRDDEEKLFRAFQALDSDHKGYLLPEQLSQHLSTEGEPFDKEELEEMLRACADPTDGKIWYEDFVTVLAQ
ncbi:hypothetical protein BC832DRAFT_76381 [Gaertneriomyces semiglobifer]|nr:hypothetical protein BC832DRAFT_76381 [Gaertneriomyces semiglobifer]